MVIANMTTISDEYYNIRDCPNFTLKCQTLTSGMVTGVHKWRVTEAVIPSMKKLLKPLDY